ncbi:hypothetical protein [Saccharothrix sp. ST-888]|uniref:hypothetical protein n=1 Tax=Saccharothrix sp. ST-888 TaxID=1427391 RepID=UPI0012E091FD|nr:hypothetical protein [Saccharothrix sp. ST-888]
MAETARKNHKAVVDRSEGFGERLLGRRLDRTHEMPPAWTAQPESTGLIPT